MQFGYTIIYVKNVEATLSFYEKAFNLKILFLHESTLYGELDTGATKLAFADESMIVANNLKATIHANNTTPSFDIALVTEEVEKAFTHACNNGAVAVLQPKQQPWGQTVAYVKDLNGVLVELCSPMG